MLIFPDQAFIYKQIRCIIKPPKAKGVVLRIRAAFEDYGNGTVDEFEELSFFDILFGGGEAKHKSTSLFGFDDPGDMFDDGNDDVFDDDFDDDYDDLD